MPSCECGLSSSVELVRFGPTLEVRIGFDPQFRSEGIPKLPSNPHLALVDTGALESCIDSQLAEALRLPIVDRKAMAGVQGLSEANIHLAQIFIPALDFTIYGGFSGVHLAAGGQPHYALIGRTFLQRFIMHYEGTTGKVSLVRQS